MIVPSDGLEGITEQHALEMDIVSHDVRKFFGLGATLERKNVVSTIGRSCRVSRCHTLKSDDAAPHAVQHIRTVGVWLRSIGAYATAKPRPSRSEENDWALTGRVSEIAKGVAAAHGWHWLDAAVAQVVFPGFHFERWSYGEGVDDDDVADPTVMDLLFP